MGGLYGKSAISGNKNIRVGEVWGGERGAQDAASASGEKRANDERVYNDGRGNDGRRIKLDRSTAGVIGSQQRWPVRIDGARRSDGGGCPSMSCHICLRMHQ
jgi:hypothetical protein